MSEISPRPWRVDSEDVWADIWDDSNGAVGDGMRLEDAEYIVKCVNEAEQQAARIAELESELRRLQNVVGKEDFALIEVLLATDKGESERRGR